MQSLIAGLLVLLATAEVLRRYLPRSLKQALRRTCARLAQRLGWHPLAQRLTSAPAASGGCAGGCSGCSAAQPAPATIERMCLSPLEKPPRQVTMFFKPPTPPHKDSA